MSEREREREREIFELEDLLKIIIFDSVGDFSIQRKRERRERRKNVTR